MLWYYTNHSAELTEHLQVGQSRQGSQVMVPEGNSRNISKRGPYTFL